MSKSLGTIEKLPSGNYRLSYTKDKKRYRKTVKADSLKEAKKLLYTFISETENSKALYHNMSFKELASLWITDYLEKNATTTTVEIAIINIKNHVIPFLGNYKIKTITPAIINNFINELRNKRKKDGSPYSINSIKKTYNNVRSILSFAYRMSLIDENPCNRVQLKLESNEKQDLHFYTVEQAKIFLKELENEDLKYQLIFKLALFNGLRRSEVLGLKWDDINIKEKTIHVQRTRQKIKGGTELSKTKTKGSNRILTLSNGILEQLNILRNDNESEFIFPNIYPDTLTKKFHNICKRVNLPLIKLHDLRHTCATLLLANGIDIRTVAGYLGHSNIKTTMIYLHALDDKFKDASNKIDSLLK